MNPSEEVLSKLPQKPPFLFVDEIHSRIEKKIFTHYHVTGDENFFPGHFPDEPIVPGVILQEALFQSAALLMHDLFPDSGGRGVVTRVGQGKFRKIVRPGETLEMEVELTDEMGGAYFFKGKTLVAGKTAVVLEFGCALA